MFNIPSGILAVLAGLAGIHLLRQIIPEAWDDRVLLGLAFEPGTLTFAADPARVLSSLRALAMQGDEGLRQAQFGRFVLDQGGVQPWTVLTYGLLHADWAHIGLNGLWLLAFGTPVARRLGTARFWLFLGAASVAGALVHYATHPLDLTPVIGASAAVSGCMGAALRFMFQPARPVTDILGFADRDRIEPAEAAIMPFSAMLRDRRVVTFLIVWFLTNLVFGLVSQPLGLTSGAIAWEAHIGGFLFGILALPVFDRRRASEPPPEDR